MKLINRFIYFFVELSIGLIFLAFLFQKKNTKFNYLPNSRVINDINSKKIHVIDLFSVESNAFRKIQLQVESTTLKLFNIILYDKNGGSFTYLITDFQTDFEKNNTNDYLFNLEDYPEVEVIDLR